METRIKALEEQMAQYEKELKAERDKCTKLIGQNTELRKELETSVVVDTVTKVEPIDKGKFFGNIFKA